MKVLSYLAAALTLPFAINALKLNAPTGHAVSGGQLQVTWDVAASDPTNWELFLVDATVAFSLYGTWSGFDTTAGHLNVTLQQDLTAR
ncbi:hypothetical protein M422DRAFT_267590 [Sphaerobolus stellatus SS14]|uniref:Uncharacterized protein n=1 Tax=Sphaerobolus stellatus (strain SS14) TaxID=990650 RepID=A0A0C9UZU2_SPHS4|nr:hypothetical protein M422DRAFT_267590 [Sphaerobolus stellatus SS14]